MRFWDVTIEVHISRFSDADARALASNLRTHLACEMRGYIEWDAGDPVWNGCVVLSGGVELPDGVAGVDRLRAGLTKLVADFVPAKDARIIVLVEPSESDDDAEAD